MLSRSDQWPLGTCRFRCFSLATSSDPKRSEGVGKHSRASGLRLLRAVHKIGRAGCISHSAPPSSVREANVWMRTVGPKLAQESTENHGAGVPSASCSERCRHARLNLHNHFWVSRAVGGRDHHSVRNRKRCRRGHRRALWLQNLSCACQRED